MQYKFIFIFLGTMSDILLSIIFLMWLVHAICINFSLETTIIYLIGQLLIGSKRYACADQIDKVLK